MVISRKFGTIKVNDEVVLNNNNNAMRHVGYNFQMSLVSVAGIKRRDYH